MNISIVIPVSNDLRLQRCIESIDEVVEVVISLNKPSTEIKTLTRSLIKAKKYSHLRFKVCEIPQPSIAQAYNNGIATASYHKILLMDSDCIFQPGCIKKLNDNLGENLLSKGKVIFTHDSQVTAIIAKAREFHTSDKISAFSPPLLFDKKIKKYIGGYYFHPKLCWLEDSEFDSRVQATKLNISYDPTAQVLHPPLTPLRDLRSAFWYGVGKRIGVENGVHQKPTGVIGSIQKYIFSASQEKGVLAGSYLFLWKMALLSGYYTQAVYKLR